MFFDVAISELINCIGRFLTSGRGVEINHTLVESALIETDGPSTILNEPWQGPGSNGIYRNTSRVKPEFL